MLAKVSELSGGQSMHTNLALLRNNARLAARIARAMTPGAGVEIA
jgi:pseudouridine-5'-phosphate glycosidase